MSMSGTPSQFDLSAWKPLNLQTTSLHTSSNTKDVPNAGDGGRGRGGGGGGGGRRRGGRNFGGPSRHRQQRFQNDQSTSTPTPQSSPSAKPRKGGNIMERLGEPASVDTTGAITRADKDGDVKMDSLDSRNRFNPYYHGGGGKGGNPKRGGAGHKGRPGNHHQNLKQNQESPNKKPRRFGLIIQGFDNISPGNLIEFLLSKSPVPTQVLNTQEEEGGRKLVIEVANRQQSDELVKLNGTSFGQQKLLIRPKYTNESPAKPPTRNVIELLRTFIQTRYDPVQNYLNLERIDQDPLLVSAGVRGIGQHGSAGNMGPALIKLIKEQFPNVVTISLADNKLRSCAHLASISTSLPCLRNLSLQNNQISTYAMLEYIGGKKASNIRELILLDNPVRNYALKRDKGDDQIYRNEVLKRFPNLEMLDMVPVTSRNIVFEFGCDSAALEETPPVPMQLSFFDNPDTQSTSTFFLTTFFQAWDNDRSMLAPLYATNAQFSLAVDRPPSKQIDPSIDLWVEEQRNLVRVKDLHRRVKTLHIGPENIMKLALKLPATRHPVQEKSTHFLVDAWQQVMSPTVTILCISVHGEFEEVKTAISRSFDRTIVLTPSAPDSRARAAGYPFEIINDLVQIRAHSTIPSWQKAVPPPPTSTVAAVPLPAGTTVDSSLELMVNQLRAHTGLNDAYARLCLTETEWNLERALEAFQISKASGALPQEAFL